MEIIIIRTQNKRASEASEPAVSWKNLYYEAGGA
jgi:hypothetical protein